MYINILFKSLSAKGTLEVNNGRLIGVRSPAGRVEGNRFDLAGSLIRLQIELADTRTSSGPDPTAVTLWGEHGFTFLARDVLRGYPIYMPEFGVAVTEGDDARDYDEIAADIESRGLQTCLQRIESEPEETFEQAAANTRDQKCQTWLGFGRDIRLFAIVNDPEQWWFTVEPRLHGWYEPLEEFPDRQPSYYFFMGRGAGCVNKEKRWLDDGVLPILHFALADDDISYHWTTFVSLETTPLTSEVVRGTHHLVAFHYCGGTLTGPDEEMLATLKEKELHTGGSPVLYCRMQATNTGKVPRYAYFKGPLEHGENGSYDPSTGFGLFDTDRVFAVEKMNGKPLPNDELAMLLKPGETATVDVAIPHSPVSAVRAARIAAQDFEARRAECREYWRKKLESASRLRVPEQRVDEMIRAGLLHLDIVAYGKEPDGPVAPTIGVYAPIGTESSPIMQFMDSMGWHDLARRCLEYFLDRQSESGLIQNYGGYMVETQAVLWNIGEHFRYTRDVEWAKRISPKVHRACDFLIDWRRRNQREELRDCGYGMVDGKAADPEDPYRIYMVNGYVYLGLSRIAETYADIEPEWSKQLAAEAEDMKRDIRDAFFKSTARSPVVPVGNGEWRRTTAPWSEASAAQFLLTGKDRVYTHRAYTAKDSMLGPHYLAFQEVLDPNEPATQALLDYSADLMHMRNVALSQPYYSRHPEVHLKRGEVKAFLKAWYNGFAGLADRETYTFWEHYFHVSPHKTHEEGWFLMETRWMLYMEEGRTLRLLQGIPRAWIRHGERIEIENAASYFGKFTLKVDSQVETGRIRASIECRTDRKPDTVLLRLPHPDALRASRVDGGVYDAAKETVVVERFCGHADVELVF